MVQLHISPEVALIDETIDIRVTGLRQNEPVTLVARLNYSKMKFESFAHYTATSDGSIHLATDASTGGCYQGVEDMGLFWSLKQAPGQPPGLRLAKKDVTTPYIVDISVYLGHLSTADCTDQLAVATKSVRRYYLSDNVERIPVKHERIVGTLFIPKGPGPHPGVVDLFGTVGGLVEHRSALLASRGFATLALAYYWPDGKGITIDMEYFETAVDILRSHPRVCGHGVGVVGVSKGADIGILLAAVCPKVKAVVSINGYPYPVASVHTYQGETFPMVQIDGNKLVQGEEGMSFLHIYEDFKEDIVIPVERSKNAHFLLIHSGDDQSAPAVAADIIPARLRKHGRPDACEVVVLPGAGHLLEPPHTPCFRTTKHSMMGGLVLWGGRPREHARAQEAAWARMLQFLHKHLQPSHPITRRCGPGQSTEVVPQYAASARPYPSVGSCRGENNIKSKL